MSEALTTILHATPIINPPIMNIPPIMPEAPPAAPLPFKYRKVNIVIARTTTPTPNETPRIAPYPKHLAIFIRIDGCRIVVLTVFYFLPIAHNCHSTLPTLPTAQYDKNNTNLPKIFYFI